MAMKHHTDKKFKWRIAIFCSLFVLSVVLHLVGLTNNANGAVERYNALIAVDKAGGDVKSSLNDLRGFIYSHMNSEIGGPNGIYPPIQLSGTYDRLTAAELDRVDKINGNLYAEAQLFCEANGSRGFSGGNRVGCIDEYVSSNGATVQSIDESFYKYDFVAPRLSFDLAGISLLLSGLFGIIAVINVLMYRHTRHLVALGN